MVIPKQYLGPTGKSTKTDGTRNPSIARESRPSPTSEAKRPISNYGEKAIT